MLALLRREEPDSVLAHRIGVSEPTLYRWCDEFLAAGETAMATRKSPGQHKARQIAELEKKIAKRDQVIGELTITNEELETCMSMRYDSSTFPLQTRHNGKSRRRCE